MKSPAKGISRRGFLAGAAALGTAASLYGCTDKGKTAQTTTTAAKSGGKEEIVVGSSGHNCGGRCITRAIVKDGRIQRFLTDESTHAFDGTPIDPESRNFPQTRACARCRAYKYRIYHPGRLQYPLKQTKKRGDLSGFVRISWEQAISEIVQKHKTVLDKYGVDGIYQIYACGSVSSNFNGSQSGPIGKTNGYAIKAMGGVTTPMFGSYSRHQHGYFGVNYTGMDSEDGSFNTLAKHSNTLVLWGDNSMSTSNPTTYGSVRAVEDMKKRNPNAKVIFIGPEFVDTGVTIADEWVVSKPFTDPALIAGMVYHMLDNTFDLKTGALKKNPWLDVDYLDTLVYGFFDSPAYGLNEATGEIDASKAMNGDRKIGAVAAGRSYVSWILGNSAVAKTYADTATNYTAAQYAKGGNMKRWAPCSQPVKKGSATQYQTKKDFKTPKTPAWASKITGVPEATIKELAQVYVKNVPVNSRWSGGQQKQADGIANLYAVEALHVITKNVGTKGATFCWLPFKAATLTKDKGLSLTFSSKMMGYQKPVASCTAWHTAIKMSYADELMKNGYRAKYIPNWDRANKGMLKTGDGDIYWDDGGTKAMIAWERDEETGKILTFEENGKTFFKWKGKDEGKAPQIAGIRLLYNAGGNIFINQHENSNDSREMMEYLPLSTPNDPNSYCMVSIDNFMSATPRWSDYVLPASTFWEQDDIVTPVNNTPFFTRKAIDAPGESKTLWDIGMDLVKEYEKATGQKGLVEEMLGGEPDTVEEIIKKRFENAPEDSVYKKMKWDEYKNSPFVAAKPNDELVPTPKMEPTMQNFKAADIKAPFVKKEDGWHVPTNEVNQGGYGNDYADTNSAPKSPLRYQVFSPVLVWQYENKFNKWHGYLPEGRRGQHNTDFEGDRLVTELPLYYAYEDYFMEAYGGANKLKELPFLLTTTHNRYRSHSSMAENPMLRELSHRVPGHDENGYYQKHIEANDFGDYSAMPEFQQGKGAVIPELERAINPDGSVSAANKGIASYSEVWLNETDAKQMEIADGDLVQIENPVGAVRCVAKLSKRCARGFIGLHQGNWYDPRPLPNTYGHDNVDVGGNCNTLMASQPSRIDHGNGQQSAMVKIYKVKA